MRFRLLAVLLLLGAASCTAHVDRMRAFRDAWHAGDAEKADREIDRLIAPSLGKTVDELQKQPKLSEKLDASGGNRMLFALEKAMTSLALGRFEISRKLLAAARAYYDEHIEHTIADSFASLGDDESRSYVGNDYEHLMIRVMAGIVEMMEGGEEAVAHMLSMDEVQERIISSDYGSADGKGYRPRKSYKRLEIGSYFAGILYEGEGQGEEAERRFRRALELSDGKPPILRNAVMRAKKGQFAPFGSGALHVIYLAGQGPYYVEGTSAPTEQATQLATIGIAIAGKSASALIQAPVPVPYVAVSDAEIPPLSVWADDGSETQTELLLDTNRVVASQLEANMPWILARAVARRAVKAAIAATTERSVRKNSDGLAGFLAGLAVNLALTSGERAETRCWMSLPAEIQVARVVLKEGTHRVGLSDGTKVRVRITKGRNSFLLLQRPQIGEPGYYVVDRHSRVAEEDAGKTKGAAATGRPQGS